MKINLQELYLCIDAYLNCDERDCESCKLLYGFDDGDDCPALHYKQALLDTKSILKKLFLKSNKEKFEISEDEFIKLLS